MKSISTPLSHRDVVGLKAGDRVMLSGTVFTARDRAHVFLLGGGFERIAGGVIYHCGPIVRDGRIVAAGPTTSARMNPYTPDIIRTYGIRAVIGKGGMNAGVLEALRGRAVYLSATGGAAVSYADMMKVAAVHKEEFGMPEAIWELEVRDLPLVVSMDSWGNSLHDNVCEESRKALDKLLY